MGDLGFPGARGRGDRPGVPERRSGRCASAGLNIMMSMKGDGKPISFHRRLRGAARRPRRLHRPADPDLRQARHPRHLVRARLGRLPACAAGPEPQAGARRQEDARDRRGGVRDGARIQGLAFGRARRRAGALGVPRADVRLAHRARLRGGEGRVRPGRAVQPRQDRAAARRWTTAACSASGRTTAPLPLDTALDWSEWGGFAGAVEMCNNNGACREPRRRRDVPVLSAPPATSST